jgi:glutathione S-transferase
VFIGSLSFKALSMVTLYHHPLCPHSRFARLVLGEFGMDVELKEERIWERREDFLRLNPMGSTPVMVEDAGHVIPTVSTLMEYMDETRGLALGDHRLLPNAPDARVEVRRLCEWFHVKFFEEVSLPLVNEKVYRRFMPAEYGGGAPDMVSIRAARHNIRYHLRFMGLMLRSKNWLAGDRLSYADLAAAAHLSALDYIGDVPWDEDRNTREWYAKMKSRPSFRALLQDKMIGMVPPAHYANLDF